MSIPVMLQKLVADMVSLNNPEKETLQLPCGENGECLVTNGWVFLTNVETLATTSNSAAILFPAATSTTSDIVSLYEK
jgi:hypothetical protein